MGPCLTLSLPYANERSLKVRNEVIVQPFLAEGVWYLDPPTSPTPTPNSWGLISYSFPITSCLKSNRATGCEY